jgi:hypothetical protein
MILRRIQKLILMLLTICSGLFPQWAIGDFDHSQLDALLGRNVVVLEEAHTTQVNYGAMSREREQLQSYLAQLSQVTNQEFESWQEAEQLAFLINAYNAWVIELVLTEFPDLDSIQDVGSIFRSPFARNFISLFGDTVSLDHIEHELIRGPDGFGEPRIHFAVNCASIGCPALRGEAYNAVDLEQQLDAATAMFLADPTRNGVDGNTLRVSKIFDWYEEDFEAGWRGTRSVSEFIALYAEQIGLAPDTIARLKANDLRVRYLRYDWSLNSTN